MVWSGAARRTRRIEIRTAHADFARLRACRTLGKHSNYTTTLFIENGIDSLPDVVMRNLNCDLRQ